MNTLSPWSLQTLFAGLINSFPVLHTILSLHTPPYLETRATLLKYKLINIPNLLQTIQHCYYSETETYSFPMVDRALHGVPHHPSDISTHSHRPFDRTAPGCLWFPKHAELAPASEVCHWHLLLSDVIHRNLSGCLISNKARWSLAFTTHSKVASSSSCLVF